MYNTSVQAIGKTKHIIFRHLSTAVDNTVCHNINRTVFTKLDKAYENDFFVEFGQIIVNKLRFFFLQNSTELSKKCEKIQEMRKLVKNAIMHAKTRSHFSKVSNYTA